MTMFANSVAFHSEVTHVRKNPPTTYIGKFQRMLLILVWQNFACSGKLWILTKSVHYAMLCNVYMYIYVSSYVTACYISLYSASIY